MLREASLMTTVQELPFWDGTEKAWSTVKLMRGVELGVNVTWLLRLAIRLQRGYDYGVHGSAFLTSDGIQNFLKNIRNSAEFLGIFCSKICRNSAEFRMYLHTEFRR
jgi:hypothetical protein